MPTIETASRWNTNFQDPDTKEGVRQYARQGLRLATPDMHREDPFLGETAQECSTLLERVYRGNYPLDVHAAATLEAEIRQGTTHLFTLADNAGIRAMSAIVKKQNPFGAPIHFAELGRSCKDPEADLSVRALLKMRIGWNRDQDFLYSVTRTAADQPAMPGGKGVQSVWWGARRPDTGLPLLTTTTGYDYRLGKPEPFNGFVIPSDPVGWGEAAYNLPVYVATEEDKQVLDTMFEEATNGAVQPSIRHTSTSRATAMRFATLQPSSEVAGGQYALTHHPIARDSLPTIDTAYREGAFSQKITIESDVASTPEGGRAMQELYEGGWSLAGWQPSQLTRGGICPVVTRLHPTAAQEAVPPMFHTAYFDARGLGGTREALETMYTTMHEHVGSRALTAVKLSV